MVYSKKNSENNAECGVSVGFNETAMIIFGAGNFDRCSTSNFVMEITTFDPTQSNKVIARENVFFTSRVGNQFNVGTRAYEPVPIDDDQTSNIQQALPFSATNTVMKQVVSKKLLDDLQDEVVALGTSVNTDIPATYATKEEVAEGDLSYNASSEASDTYKVTIPNITEYKNGQRIFVKADVDNTGACTVEVNALGPIDVKNVQGTADLLDGDWEAGKIATLIYNSTGPIWQFSGQNAILSAFDPKDIYFGDGSDGALVVTNGQTVTLDNDIYQYTSIDIQAGGIVNRTVASPLKIKCQGTCTVEGDVDLIGLTETVDKLATSSQFALAFGVGGNGGNGSFRSSYPTGTPGTNTGSYVMGAGGSGGSTSNSNYRGGAGGNAGFPGGSGGAGGSGSQSGSGGGLSSGGGGGSNGNTGGSGGSAYGNNGNTDTGSQNGGGGGAGSGGGGVLFLNAFVFAGAGNINCNGGIGATGGLGSYAGGGGGGGGGGGAIGVIYGSYTFSGALNVNGGAGGVKGSGTGTGGAATNGSAGTSGSSNSLDYTIII